MRLSALLKKQFVVWGLGVLVIVLASCGVIKQIPDTPLGTGYAASEICSQRFISNQDMDLIMEDAVAEKVQPLHHVWRLDINEQDKTVTISAPFFKGLNKATAVYREGLGCTLAMGLTPEELRAQPFNPATPPVVSKNDYWPDGEAGAYPYIPNMDYDRINDILNSMFEEKYADDASKHINTYVTLLIYNNKLVAERYSKGHSKDTRFVGWSMTKTVTAMLLGILHGQGKVDINDTLEQWRNTDKAAINLKHILHTSTGLEWNERYEARSSLSEMLYSKQNMAEYVRSKPIFQEPGKVLHYSTGNTQLLAEVITQKVGGTLQDVYNFYQKNLFHKINVTSALFEHDASGVFIGCGRAFMTARDWARLGLLLCNKGHHKREQIIPESWVNFMLTPSPNASYYGAQIWLNTSATRNLGVPTDHFSFQGSYGQYIICIPSAKLVVVRLGAWAGGVDEEKAALDLFTHVNEIMAALPKTPL